MKFYNCFMTMLSITLIIFGAYIDNHTAMISSGIATGIWLACILYDIFEDFNDFD